LGVISFHALEDSIVRHFLKETHSEVSYLRSRTKVAGKARTRTWLPLHKNVIYPTDEEVYLNPRSRSAKLRAAGKADNLVVDLTELTNLLDKNSGQTFYNGTSPPVIHLEIESAESWDSLGHLSMSPRPTIVSPRAKNLIKISRNV